MTELVSRTDLVHDRLDHDGSGIKLRPFWNYRQTSLDKHAIRWTPRTNLDGSFGGLYIQLPYGYQDDVLKSKNSVILREVIENMRKTGHEDWADIVQKDMISSVDWRSNKCQTIGVSYDPSYTIETDVLQALSNYEPYHITSFNDDLTSAYSADELAMSSALMDVRRSTHGSAVTLVVSGVIMLAFNSGVGLGILGAAMLIYGLKRIRKSNTVKKLITKPVRRPGYILETSDGWLCWQYNDGKATPHQLADSATKEVEKYIGSKHGGKYSVPPAIMNTAVSSDGRMAWFQSNRRLDSECTLKPYEAERYLSLYVKHQSAGNTIRSFEGDEPIVINSTIGYDSESLEAHPLDGVIADRNEADEYRKSIADKLKTLDAEANDLKTIVAGNTAVDSTHATQIADASIRLARSDLYQLDGDGLAQVEAAADAGLQGIEIERKRLVQTAEDTVNVVAPSISSEPGNDDDHKDDHVSPIEDLNGGPINPFSM
jgi:hypothetical protein